ncbi:metallophosphoesterase [Sutterella massiliensis]|uniref:Metallophosphoesterase n=1 Tax=Sutterella massiliensis TaxID=1816689 RepID=A0ABS2DRP6_9BURK|nr:metallophosphoesterase [Sutterella massiliensis]MBM6704015.1 metallophosphoesterase [Sutterella massiliensis]
MPTILQLSDLHVEPRGRLAFGRCDSAGLLESIRPWLVQAAEKVDAVVVTGDIGCDGNEDAYRIVKDVFTGLSVPVRMIPGNHDRRVGIEAVLGDFIEGRLEAVPGRQDQLLDIEGARIVLLDTLQPGKHWGEVPDAVLDRLEVLLDEAAAQAKPAIVFTHHTPLHCGMGVMDEDFGNRKRFLSILAKHPSVRLATGHMHRAIVQSAGATLIATAPSVACPIAIDLTPKGGDEFRLETPGFALHHWKAEPEGVAAGWTTFFGLIPVQTSFAGPFRFKDVVNPTE